MLGIVLPREYLKNWPTGLSSGTDRYIGFVSLDEDNNRIIIQNGPLCGGEASVDSPYGEVNPLATRFFIHEKVIRGLRVASLRSYEEAERYNLRRGGSLRESAII